MNTYKIALASLVYFKGIKPQVFFFLKTLVVLYYMLSLD